MLNKRLFDQIKEASEIQLQKSQILLAIYSRKIEEIVEKNVNDLKDKIRFNLEQYGVNESLYSNRINEIIKKYYSEIETITTEYENLYANVEIELQEAVSNQQIAVVNVSRILDYKAKFLRSEEYKKYLKTKEELKYQLENSVQKAEFDEITKRIENLVDPLEMYDKKVNACIEKFNKYKEVIKACEEKKNECIKSVENELEKLLVLYSEKSLAVSKKSNGFFGIFKIFNLINGKSKFEKRILDDLEIKLIDMNGKSESIVNVIETNVIEFVAKIKTMKNAINAEYDLAIK